MSVRTLSARALAVPPGLTGATRRRARTLLGIATILALAVFPTSALVALYVPSPARNVPVVLAGLVFYAVIRTMIQRTWTTAAAWLFVGYFVAVPLNGLLLDSGPQAVDLLFVPVIPVMAALVLPARHVLLATALAVADLLVLSIAGTGVTLETDRLTVYVVILLTMLAAAAIALTVIIDGAFEDVDRTKVEAQRLATELQVANTDLESRVRTRTTELAEALQREKKLSAQLAELSIRDSLTGLHNRRHMDETIDQMFRYAQRSGHPLSVAIIDLDDFKRINDRFTHLVGDDVLKQAAAVFTQAIRGSDELVRMGGEEFALLMPGTSPEEAMTVCERMRRAIAEHDWSTLGADVTVTASFGIATTGTCHEVRELMLRADQQLLLAKQSGKNRILIDSVGVR